MESDSHLDFSVLYVLYFKIELSLNKLQKQIKLLFCGKTVPDKYSIQDIFCAIHVCITWIIET